MIVRKFLSFKAIFSFAGFHFVWLFVYMLLVTVMYQTLGWHWLSIPWLPVSLVGTAVAFYIGFKNNQSYDRLWEARKHWGAIVNSSRSWGTLISAYIKNKNLSDSEVQTIKNQLIYNHIAWIYTLREQLLVPTPWEHVSLGRHFGDINIARRESSGVGRFKDYLDEKQQKRYFAEQKNWETAENQATEIIHYQSQQLASLESKETVNLFMQIEMQKVLLDFFEHQGKLERIKKFPLPRQYANMSFIFNSIFIFLLPFGMIGEFSKLGDTMVWLTIPIGALVGWIYVIMELIGDYSENPFEGLMTDVPMLSICRTIEIDLLKMIGETDLPKPIQAVNDILM